MATKTLPYQDRIVRDPQVLVGKPVVKGTRIPVDLVLSYLARNPNFDELFLDYPRLTLDDVKACLGYAGAVIEERETTKRPSPGSAVSSHV